MASNSHIDPRLQQPTHSVFGNVPAVTGESPGSASANSNATSRQPYYLPSTHAHQNAPASATTRVSEPEAMDEETPEDEQDNEHEPDAGQNGDTGQQPGQKEGKRPRACDACRSLKVKCDQEPTQPQVPCKRCAKAGRQCITTPPTRKRQKKADSRVAELEKKIDALTATLSAQRAGRTGDHGMYPPVEPSPHSASPYTHTSPSLSHSQSNHGSSRNDQNSPMEPPSRNDSFANKRRRLENERSYANEIRRNSPECRIGGPDSMPQFWHNLTEKRQLVFDHSDIGRKLDKFMDAGLIERIFQHYVKGIMPQFPAVIVSSDTTAADLRAQKPILFLSILASSCFGMTPAVPLNVQRELQKILKDQLADSLLRNFEKSLELIQALQVTTLWYRPPPYFEQHNFHQNVHLACVMCMDIGLNRRTKSPRLRIGASPFRNDLADPDSVEARRAWLVCYLLSMSITMVHRRPMFLRFDKYLDECLSILQESPNAVASDRIMIQHVKLAHIAEEVAQHFAMDDASGDVSMADAKVQYQLKVMENQLRDCNIDTDNISLRINKHVTNLYIHEIALHFKHNTDDLGGIPSHPTPWTEETFKSAREAELFGASHIAAISDCVSGCHGILDSYLALPCETIFTLPLIFSVRCIFSTVCLMKLWVAVTTPGEIGLVIKKEDLRLEYFFEALLRLFQQMVDKDSNCPHAKFLFISRMLKERFVQLKSPEGAREERSIRQQAIETQEILQRQSTGGAGTQQSPLHLLSEVAMGSSPNASNLPASSTANYDPQLIAPQIARGIIPPAQQQQTPWPPYDPGNMLQSQQAWMGIDTGFDLGGALGGYDLDLDLGGSSEALQYWLDPMWSAGGYGAPGVGFSGAAGN
ncbi:hypothetical protein M501DRAFT_1002083 [Patellaria atrata CBS 101060]|uniref:Zn(2)-C6 fungal-type domain-containing protein n=1 Tax=Patellaria atrata CBS 101060 TaxID=1346257 RepID=A0A9P4SDY3_9PEZI|nr:hypothetical protein M501DRAFT_1002083 [Patellaria atrata CBS 101060]